jgi:L-alanine-DL-glutamate epimerase-like enolase superfamily enzyme
MLITRIDVWNFAPTFRDGPYVMSHVTQDHAYGRILQIQTDKGIYGLGEIVFPPSLADADRLNQIASEPGYLADLPGKNISGLIEVTNRLREEGKVGRAAAFGIETATFDIMARADERPLSSQLGGVLTRSVDDYFSISETGDDRIRQRIVEASADRRVFQLKLGIGTPDDDVRQIGLMLAHMSDDQLLLADANGGWSIPRALETIARFDDPRIMWEEPCPTYDENLEIAQRCQRPVMVDQCVGDPATARRAIADKAAAAICIKPAFIGGLTPAREFRDLAAAAGMKMRIDGPWCGDIAIAAILHLAVGAPPELLISSCDLREPLVLTPCLGGVRDAGGTRIAPPEGPGLGITLITDQLGPPETTYA